jgi:hypothetical protein
MSQRVERIRHQSKAGDLGLWKNLLKFAGMADADASYSDYSDKYFKNVTSGQLADGLDAFYSDFANRSILTSNGVWLVLNQIAGTPNVNTMILNWRKNAHQ